MVDGVETGAAAQDDLEVGAHVDEVFAHLGARAHDHALVVGQFDHQLFGGDIVTDIHGETRGAHLFDVFLFCFVTDDDFHWFYSYVKFFCTARYVARGTQLEINNRNPTGEPAAFLFVKTIATRRSF